MIVASPDLADAVVISRDPDARDVRATGGVVSWLHVVPDGEDTRVSLRYRIDGRTRWARGLPAASTHLPPTVFGDLGRDARGRVVQVIGESQGYLSFRGEYQRSQRPFWAFDLVAGSSAQLALPALPPDCIVERMAVWHRRVAVAANCGGDGVVFLARGALVERLLVVPALDRYAFSTVELDVTGRGVAVGLARKRCAERSASGACEIELGLGDMRYDAWLLRPGCAPRLLARADHADRALDRPQLDGGRVVWLDSRRRVASLRARRLRGRCGLGATARLARLGAWQSTVAAAVSGDDLFVTRDRRGVRRRTLP